jgi:phosphate/phosphite/phosphonate ABC transporter binding protein
MSSRKHRRWNVLFFVTLVLANIARADTSNFRADDSRDRVLVLGKVSDDPEKHFRYLKPMADYLASKLNDLGIIKGDVLLAKDNQQMIHYLKAGRVDLVTESVVSTALFSQKALSVPLVRKWKNATPSYQSLIFVRNNSDIYSLTDLLGKRIALEDPGSTTAFFIPVATLLLEGLTVTTISSPRDRVPADSVGTYVTHDDKVISPLVFGGVVDAGALSSIDWQKNKRVPKKHKQAYRIIYRSNPWPRMLESVGTHVDSTIRERIKNTLITAHLDPEAESALYSYQKTSRFEVLNQEDRNALNEAQQLLSAISEVSVISEAHPP